MRWGLLGTGAALLIAAFAINDAVGVTCPGTACEGPATLGDHFAAGGVLLLIGAGGLAFAWATGSIIAGKIHAGWRHGLEILIQRTPDDADDLRQLLLGDQAASRAHAQSRLDLATGITLIIAGLVLAFYGAVFIGEVGIAGVVLLVTGVGATIHATGSLVRGERLRRELAA